MRTILAIFFIFGITDLVVAQSHSSDTTFKSNKQVLRVSTKDIDSDFVLLTATFAMQTALNDTIDNQGLYNIEFPDFNNDGYSDIMVSYSGNNTTYFLYLFDPATKKFKDIYGYMGFPEAVPLMSKKKLLLLSQGRLRGYELEK